MIKSVEQKWVLVTGAATGIGYEVAKEFASHGANIVATDISLGGLTKLVRELDGKCKVLPFELNVVDRTQYDSLFADLDRQGIELDILINNAGIAWIGTITEHDSAMWKRIMDVNVMGVVNGVQAVLPKFLESNSPKHIVNISSVAGLCPPANLSAYSASKAAVLSFSDTLGIECLGTNVGVTCVHPGIINTSIVNTATHGESITTAQLNHLQAYYKYKGVQPSAVAKDIYQAVISNAPRLLTGTGASMAGVLKRILPTKMFWEACKKASLEAGYMTE